MFAGSLDTPVNILPFETASAAAPTPVLVSTILPEPSSTASPTAAPVLTPPPVETLAPLPTYPPVPTFGPLPTWPPFPVLPPLPTLAPPDPTLPPVKVCLHPGTHLGVDACKWPHN